MCSKVKKVSSYVTMFWGQIHGHVVYNESQSAFVNNERVLYVLETEALKIGASKVSKGE